MDMDDSWLNDTRVAPPHSSSPQHRISYEDVPTMSLEALQERLRQQEQFQGDVDATQRLSTRVSARKAVPHVVHKTTPASTTERVYKTYKTPAVSNSSHRVAAQSVEYGPIQPLMDNVHIRSITALGPERIYVELRERCGINGRTRQVQETPYRFENEQHMMRVIESLLRSAGRSLPTSWSLSDVRLPDGSLLSVSLPPGSVQGPTFTLRKPGMSSRTLADLVHEGILDREMAQKLRKYVQERRNICICGVANSGKITLLNALCTEIAVSERIVTIEGMHEQRVLQLRQPQVIALVSQQERAVEGKIIEGIVTGMTMRHVLSHALHMDAQRIIVAHCHSNDAPALLRTMYDGCDGVMMTMHATDVRDCLSRLEVLCLVDALRSGSTAQATALLHALIRTQIAASLHVVVSMSPEGKVKEIVIMPYAQFPQNRA